MKDYNSFDYNKKIKELVKKIIDDIKKNNESMTGGAPKKKIMSQQTLVLNDKSKFAIDNASSIHNFENNIYLAGSRTIYIDEFINEENNTKAFIKNIKLINGENFDPSKDGLDDLEKKFLIILFANTF